jgi:hypothetical protein
MVRSEIDDIDFGGATVLIREKKRVRGKLSTRRVPLSPMLLQVLRDWIKVHPGGRHTFALGADVPRSGKTRDLGTQLTRDEAHDHFKRTLAGSKWEKIRGWHIFRHSFCSNCAARGVDQPMAEAERFVRVGPGQWHVHFRRGSLRKSAPPPPTEAEPLKARLIERGVHPLVADELLASRTSAEIELRMEAVDWLLGKVGQRGLRNPAGYSPSAHAATPGRLATTLAKATRANVGTRGAMSAPLPARGRAAKFTLAGRLTSGNQSNRVVNLP